VKILWILIFIFLINISKLTGQVEFEEFEEYEEIEDLFTHNKFAAAWPYYQYFLKKDSSNTDFNFKMGICYLNSRSQKEKAVACFKKVIASPDKKESVISQITYKALADAAYLTSNFDLAITNYEKYQKTLLATKNSNPPNTEEITRKIEMCKMGKELKEQKELVASLVNHKFVNTDKNNGSSYTFFSSTASPDQSSLTFTFKRPNSIKKLSADKDYFEDYTISYKTTDIHLPQSRDTSNIKKEATVAESVDGQIILIYRDDDGDANLYASSLNENEWTPPEKLNKIINNKGWEPNECISSEGNTLYFTSNRDGGFGGKDIYRSIKLPTGEWSKAINLGPAINTPYDEEAPFIHPDGVTLYFSSNRYKSKGSFDIFTSNLSDSGIWAKAIGVGYPVTKSSSNVSTVQKKSKKTNSTSEKENLSNAKDNYIVSFINQDKTPLTIVKGTIIDKDGKIPKYIEITVTNNETGEIAGIYHSNRKTGQYIFMLPPGINNNVTYEAEDYLFHSENMDISKETSFFKSHKTIELVPIATGSKDVLNNIFFEDGKASLSPASDVELNKLFDFLTLNPKLLVEISTCINKKSITNDTKLVEDKIQSVINYLVEKGIAKERIASKVYRRAKKSKGKSESERALESEFGKLEIKILNIK